MAVDQTFEEQLLVARARGKTHFTFAYLSFYITSAHTPHWALPLSTSSHNLKRTLQVLVQRSPRT